MGELVTTVTKFKAKQGSENQLINELRSFDNSSSKSWQVLSLGDNEYAAINTYESIENRTEDVASGLDWLDSITPLIDLYENGSRTEAFSGIVLYENEQMSKKSFIENQTLVEKLWKQYQINKDPKWLAEICLNVPFFDHPEVGKEIAKLLESQFHKRSSNAVD